MSTDLAHTLTVPDREQRYRFAVTIHADDLGTLHVVPGYGSDEIGRAHV